MPFKKIKADFKSFFVYKVWGIKRIKYSKAVKKFRGLHHLEAIRGRSRELEAICKGFESGDCLGRVTRKNQNMTKYHDFT